MDEPVLRVKDIVAGYGEMTILNGTTFDVRPGTITTVIGPNGAGKSTVFRTIFGMLKARSGSVAFKGTDITNAPPKRLLSLGLCYVPQGRNIFPELSVRHNLELGGVSARRDVDVAGRVKGLMDRFPMLQRKANHQASTLSGGEQKLLEIARSLLLDPQLLLIDEPSIGLSPLMVQEVFTILKDLRSRGVSVLMIEQNARSALEISDDGLVLELGRTRMQDTASKLLADPRVAQLFLGGVVGGAAA